MHKCLRLFRSEVILWPHFSLLNDARLCFDVFPILWVGITRADEFFSHYDDVYIVVFFLSWNGTYVEIIELYSYRFVYVFWIEKCLLRKNESQDLSDSPSLKSERQQANDFLKNLIVVMNCILKTEKNLLWWFFAQFQNWKG